MTWKEKDKDTVVIKFFGPIGYYYRNAEYFTSVFEELDAKYKNIIIQVHSYGGLVFEGNVIYNSILNANASVTIDIVGVSASMMTICMLAAVKVRMADNAYVMIHTPSGSTDGNAKAHKANANLLEKMERNFIKRYTEKTGRPASDIQPYLDGTDHWLDADDAKALGIVDEVIPATVKNPKSLDKPDTGADPAAIYNRYTSLVKQVKAEAEPTPPTESTQNSDIMNKAELIKKFQLEGVTAESSDTAIMEALEKKQKASATQAPGNPARETAEAVINGIEATTGNKFEAKHRETLVNIGEKSGVQAMTDVIGMMKPAAEQKPGGEGKPGGDGKAPAVVSMITGKQANADDRSGWDYDKWNEKDPEGLADMEDNEWDKFAALYKAEFKVMPSR